MSRKKQQLVQTAARLYTLGVELEGTRQHLKALTLAGRSKDSAEIQEAAERFQALHEQWTELERQYLSLREEVRQ